VSTPLPSFAGLTHFRERADARAFPGVVGSGSPQENATKLNTQLYVDFAARASGEGRPHTATSGGGMAGKIKQIQAIKA